MEPEFLELKQSVRDLFEAILVYFGQSQREEDTPVESGSVQLEADCDAYLDQDQNRSGQSGSFSTVLRHNADMLGDWGRPVCSGDRSWAEKDTMDIALENLERSFQKEDEDLCRHSGTGFRLSLQNFKVFVQEPEALACLSESGQTDIDTENLRMFFEQSVFNISVAFVVFWFGMDQPCQSYDFGICFDLQDGIT